MPLVSKMVNLWLLLCRSSASYFNCVFHLSCAHLETELGLSHEAIAQLQKEKEVEERAERVTKDLECKNDL
jgi:hypothetical protein